jgi:hypothetical protein
MSRRTFTGELARRLSAKLQGNTLNTMTLLNEMLAYATEQGDENLQQTILAAMKDQTASAKLLSTWQSGDEEKLVKLLYPELHSLNGSNGTR